MKIANLLLFFLLYISIHIFSQKPSSSYSIPEPSKEDPNYKVKKSDQNQLKAYGDTMAYFDFNASLPEGWTIYNNSNNNWDWIWSDQPPRGQFTNQPAINSTTGTNGFMVMESDYYNTPLPPSVPLAMDAFFESNAIPIDSVGSVFIRFQQSFRFCCTGQQ